MHVPLSDAPAECEWRTEEHNQFRKKLPRRQAVERPRVRTHQGKEVLLDSFARLQLEGRRRRAVREGIVAGLTSRSYRSAVQCVLEAYGIEKFSVSRQFVQVSVAQWKKLCEKKLDGQTL
jgi:putative transposase